MIRCGMRAMGVGCGMFLLGAANCSKFTQADPTQRAEVSAAESPVHSGIDESDNQIASPAVQADPPEPTSTPVQAVDVLTINDETVTIEQVLSPLRPELERRAHSMSASRYGEYLLETLRNRIRSMARDLLLFQEASRRLSEQENQYLDKFTDQRVRNLIQEKFQGRQVRWEKAMAQQGQTPDEARERIRRELLIVRYLQQTLSPRVAEPTRRDMMRYYEQRREEMTTPERRQLYLIEVPFAEDAGAARARIEEALERLREGGDFETVVSEFSRGIHASRGGDWGMIESSSLHGRWSVIGPALAALESGSVSEILEGPESFFLVRAGHIEPAQEPDLSKVQIELNKAYRDRQFNRLVDELVVKLQEQAIIQPENLNLFLMAVAEASPKPIERRPAENR